jgi:hypothetical protein
MGAQAYFSWASITPLDGEVSIHSVSAELIIIFPDHLSE